jgi:hypothetical protein
MSDIDKITALLADEAIEKRIAAAIVLGEIKAKGAGVADALAATLDSGIPLLLCRSLDALGRVGAKKAVARILPLLGAHDDDVRRSAVAAVVSVGDEVLPKIRERMASATGDERRSLDAVLAALGGKDAFSTLLAGLASATDAEAAKAAAIAVRQHVKEADARQRRSYLSEIERFLDKQSKSKTASPAAIAAGVKILGYLEDEKATPTLLAFAKPKGNAPLVRQEALIALRFALTNSKGSVTKVVGALVDAAQDADRTLSQTALHTLAALDLPAEVMRRLENLVAHPEIERARFVMEMLGRAKGEGPAKVLVGAMAKLERRRAEIAGQCLREGDGVHAEAVPLLAHALLETEDLDRAWAIRNVLRPSAKKVAPALRKQLLELAMKCLAAGARKPDSPAPRAAPWEPLFAAVRDADPKAATDALRALAQKLRRGKNEDKALTVLRVLVRNEGATDDDRYQLAWLELARGAHDTRPAARAGDESLRMFSALLGRGYDVAAKLRKDVGLDEMYYVGFHFVEEGHPLGEELLRTVVEKGGRAKIARMAKSKLEISS